MSQLFCLSQVQGHADRHTLAMVTRRLIPFLLTCYTCYVLNYIDRIFRPPRFADVDREPESLLSRYDPIYWPGPAN